MSRHEEPRTTVIDANVRTWLSIGSGIDSHRMIVANQDAPAPQGEFATVLPITRRLLGVPENVDAGRLATWRTTYSLQFFRDGAWERAVQLVSWTSTPQAQVEAEKRGLTFFFCGEIRLLDDVLEYDAEWDTRAQVDVEIGYLQLLTDRPPAFQARQNPIDTYDGHPSQVHKIRIEV